MNKIVQTLITKPIEKVHEVWSEAFNKGAAVFERPKPENSGATDPNFIRKQEDEYWLKVMKDSK
jgi:hypothetical protein